MAGNASLVLKVYLEKKAKLQPDRISSFVHPF